MNQRENEMKAFSLPEQISDTTIRKRGLFGLMVSVDLVEVGRP